MTKLFLFLSILLLSSTAFSQNDNAEIKKMHDDDQSARMVVDKIDWTKLYQQDMEREKRVYELIKENKVITSKDYYYSAMIFQHGKDTTAFGMAVKHMRKAIAIDSNINKWLLAAAIDRYLMTKNEPQIYGTQFIKYNNEATFKRYKIDTTKITDAERKEYGVEILSEQLIKEKMMNLPQISSFYDKSKSIKKTLELVKSEKKKGSNVQYDIREKAINSFGYELVSLKKLEDALLIFKLNTKIYPKSANVFNSLGECLFLMDRKKEGLIAYEKALTLNPNNEGVQKIIKQNKK